MESKKSSSTGVVILTATLRNGSKVLARLVDGLVQPVTYVTNAQASKKVDELRSLGVDCHFNPYKYPKFIIISNN